MISVNNEEIVFDGSQDNLVAEYMATGELLFKELNDIGKVHFLLAMITLNRTLRNCKGGNKDDE